MTINNNKNQSDAVSPNDTLLRAPKTKNPPVTHNTQPEELSAKKPCDQSISWAVSHFLLHPGARIGIAQSSSDTDPYEFAQLCPRFQTIGLTPDKASSLEAKEKYQLPNLAFMPENMDQETSKAPMFDGILNAFNLHKIYSLAGYSRSHVKHYLKQQMHQLKTGGSMVIQGYISPDDDENHCVLIELSDYQSNAYAIDKLSEAELLIRFSQTARPLSKTGCKGFYLEELAPRINHTRLFRLPYKWAQEFLLRKNKRETWYDDINVEYTPFTFETLKNQVTLLGGRLAFFAPQWNKKIIEDDYAPRCRLFDENYQLLDYPSTSYIAVIQKIEGPESITVREYRNSEEKPYYLNIDHVRDEESGRIYDLISRPKKLVDIVPYRKSIDGRLTIYARDNYARPIINTIPRSSSGLDGKFWSGHLVEPITYEVELDTEFNSKDPELAKIVKEATGLELKEKGHHFDASGHYQAPTLINEKIDTIFVEVVNPGKNQLNVHHFEAGFHDKGAIKALDAQNVLKAANVGLLADGKLELALYELMNEKDVTPETWIGEEVPIGDYQPKRIAKVDDLITDKKADKKSFKPTLRSGNTLSLQRSLFLEEGYVDGETTGMTAKSMEFALPKDETVNIAVVMPLTRDKSGEILAGFQMVDYPVPGRLGGETSQMDAPAFILPKEVKTLFDAKKYVAKQFGVKPERVGQMGASYFCDTGLMPQRIYPFVLATPAKELPYLSDFIYAPIKQIAKISFKWCKPKNFMNLIAETVHSFGVFHDLSNKPGRDAVMKNKPPKFTSLDTPKQPKEASIKRNKETRQPTSEPK